MMKAWFTWALALAAMGMLLAGGMALGEEGGGAVKLGLAEAIQRAARENTNALLATERVSEARGVRRERTAGLLPHVSGAASQARETLSLAQLGFTPGAFPGITQTKLGPFNTFDARVSLVQNVFNLASLGEMEAGRAQARKAELEEALAREQEGFAGGLAYVELLRARAMVEGSRSDVALAEHLLRQVRDQNAAGIATGIDLTRSETQLSQMQSALIQARTREQNADLALKRVIGLPLDARLLLTDALAAKARAATPLERAITEAMAARRELKVAREEIRRRGAEHRAAVGQQVPSLSATANYGAAGNQPNRNIDGTYFVGAQVSVPLFDGGATLGKISQTRSRERQAEILFKDIETQVEEDVRLAHQNLAQAEAQERATRETYGLAARELSQVEDQLKSGVVDSLALVTAENAVARTRDEYLAALAGSDATRMAFAYALGNMEGYEP